MAQRAYWAACAAPAAASLRVSWVPSDVPLKSLVAPESCAWHSIPMTASQPGGSSAGVARFLANAAQLP